MLIRPFCYLERQFVVIFISSSNVFMSFISTVQNNLCGAQFVFNCWKKISASHGSLVPLLWL